LHILYRQSFNVLPVAYLYALTQDNRGYLWLLNNAGLLRFCPGQDSFLLVNRNYGLPERRPSNALFKSKNGILFIGYRNEFYTLVADSINSHAPHQQVLITSVNVFNQNIYSLRYSGKPAEAINTLELKYNENMLSFSFVLPDYLNQAGVRYRYRLEGTDKKWTFSYSRRAQYHHLPPGRYTFSVWGCNSEGHWTPQPATLHIVIAPPFWSTWWFRAMVVAFLFCLGMLWQRQREKLLIKQKEWLEKEVRERTAEIRIQKEEIEAQADLLRRNNEELELLNHTKNKFFSIIAHDLRNPFYAISGLSDLLIRDLTRLRPDEAYEFLYTIKSSADSASSLLDNLLQWARSQTNVIAVNPVSFDLHRLIDASIKFLKVAASAKNITLTSHLKPGTIVFADENMITTVIRNLLSNAVKFTPLNGAVHITAEINHETVTFSIRDNGTGMDKETLENLFSLDRKQSSKGTAGEKGTGLGLIICKDFVEKNNGTIHVSSEPGKGSCFSVTLPAGIMTEISIAEDIAPEKREELPYLPVFKEKPLILIAEDNDELRLTLTKELEYYFTVIAAANGREGWENTLEKIPDVIISDWLMPEMDGLLFCRQVKADMRTSHIPFILLTAKSEVEEKIEGFETGADEYITKPFNIRLLVSRVYNLIKIRKKLKEQFMRQSLVNVPAEGLKPIDKDFIEKAIQTVKKHLEDPDFDVARFADELHFSRSQLHKKLVALTNQPATEFIRTIRLKEAARMLVEQDMNVSEVYARVGFNDRSYFSRMFTEMFGITPSEYKKKYAPHNSL